LIPVSKRGFWKRSRSAQNYHSGQSGPVVSFRVPDVLLPWIFRFILAEALKAATRRGQLDAGFWSPPYALARLGHCECPKRR
jgi:hypothetical protein